LSARRARSPALRHRRRAPPLLNLVHALATDGTEFESFELDVDVGSEQGGWRAFLVEGRTVQRAHESRLLLIQDGCKQFK